MAANAPVQQREQALRPYLARLIELCDPAIPNATDAPAIDAWESAVIRDNLDDDDAPRWARLIVEGAAWQAKCAGEILHRTRGAVPPEDAGRLEQALGFDCAIGLALLEELQQAIGGASREGDAERAERLRLFQGRVRATIQRLKPLIATQSLLDAEALSQAMIVERTAADDPDRTRGEPRLTLVKGSGGTAERRKSRPAPPIDDPAIRGRIDALKPFVERVEAAVISGDEQIESLETDGWERNLLNRCVLETGEEPAPWSELILQGTAWLLKTLEELSEDPAETDPEVMAIHFATDVAIGSALVEELQRVVNATIRLGDVGGARRVTQFRTRIHQTIKRIKIRLPPDEFLGAEALGSAMVIPPQLPTAPLNGKGEEDEGGPEPRTVAAAPPTPTQSGAGAEAAGTDSTEIRALLAELDELDHACGPFPPAIRSRKPMRHVPGTEEPLPAAPRKVERRYREAGEMPELNLSRGMAWGLGLMLVVLTVWGVVKLAVDTPPEPMSIVDFSHVVEIQKVVAQGKHLFFTLDTLAWEGMDQAERLEFVSRVSRTAHTARYEGAHFMTTDGRLAGQWRIDREPRLF